MSSDLSLLLDDVKNDIGFLSKCWKLQGRPIYLFLIREQNLRSPQRNDLLELLSQFKQGNVNGTPVRMERLQTLLSSACLEHLDFLDEDSTSLEFLALKELETDNSQYKSLSDLPKIMCPVDNSKAKLEDFIKLNLNELIGLLHSTTERFNKALILHALINRFGMKLQIQDTTIDEMFAVLGNDAATVQNWRTVRYCSSILHKTVDSLAPSITNILVRGKIITIGVFGHEEYEITKPLSPHQIKEIFYDKVFPYDIYQAVLIQELVINISKYISTYPEMFNGIMKLRLGWIVEVMKQELQESHITDPENDDEPLNIYALSPNDIKQLLYFILTCNNNLER
jgi:phosphorylase kinase alpha/beta subunit